MFLHWEGGQRSPDGTQRKGPGFMYCTVNITLNIGTILVLTMSPGNPGRPLSPCERVHTKMNNPPLESREFPNQAPQAKR